MVTVVVNSSVFFSGNPIWAEVTSDQLGLVQNLRIKCLVSLSDGISYRIFSVYETVNAANKFLFNLGPQINGVIRDWFDKPVLDTNFTTCSKTPITAEITFTELYEGDTGDNSTITVKIIQGGVSLEDLDKTTDWWSQYIFYVEDDPTKLLFLSNKPNQSTWIPGTPEVLYYYNKIGNNIPFRVHIECFDKYGNSLDEKVHDSGNIGIDKVICISIGKLMQERFDVAPTDGKYIVWLTTSDAQVSEKRAYYLNTNVLIHKRTITFLNKKGTFDIVTLTGRDINEGNVEGVSLKTEYIKGQKIYDGLQAVTRKSIERNIRKNTGPLNKSDRYWLFELLESKEVFEIIDFNSEQPGQARLRPILITNKQLPIVDSSEFIGSFQLEFTYIN